MGHWPNQPASLRKSLITQIVDLLPFAALLLAPVAFLGTAQD